MSLESQPRHLSAEHRANIKIGLTKPGMHEKLSAAQKLIWEKAETRENHGNKIKIALSDPEIRKRISDSHIGKPKSDETRRKISKSLKGKPSPLRGRKISKEARQKRSITLKERYKNPEFASKMKESSQTSGKFRSGKAIWDSALNENLIPQIVASRLVSQEEIGIIQAHFDKPATKRRRLPEELLDRFSIALARVA